jgi:Na+-transporting methylmalonyl-CoA/oxaloacetate decarboxylase gamma subunit
MNLIKLLAIMDGSLKYDFGNGAIVCLVAILIVFSVLLVIIGITAGVSSLLNKFVKEEKVVPTTTANNSTNNSVAINIDDEDMMAAILVATIDYRNEVKEDVKVINVREVK